MLKKPARQECLYRSMIGLSHLTLLDFSVNVVTV